MWFGQIDGWDCLSGGLFLGFWGAREQGNNEFHHVTSTYLIKLDVLVFSTISMSVSRGIKNERVVDLRGLVGVDVDVVLKCANRKEEKMY